MVKPTPPPKSVIDRRERDAWTEVRCLRPFRCPCCLLPTASSTSSPSPHFASPCCFASYLLQSPRLEEEARSRERDRKEASRGAEGGDSTNERRRHDAAEPGVRAQAGRDVPGRVGRGGLRTTAGHPPGRRSLPHLLGQGRGAEGRSPALPHPRQGLQVRQGDGILLLLLVYWLGIRRIK